jgi:uncharacterized membrane protein YraQ (UPF0718 family)
MTELIINILREIWLVLCEMAPYLLFGFFIAGILSVLISPKIVQKHLGKKGFVPILKASLIGLPIPLCSCSVIPVAASLRQSGASKGATSSFLITAPQIGVDSIFVTYALLGPIFAIFKPIAAFISGIIGGILVTVFSKEAKIDPLEEHTLCDDGCSIPQESKNKIKDAFIHGFVTIPKDIGLPLMVGLFIAGVMAAILPETFFAETIGTGIIAMLIVLGFSIPFYVCATASVPVAAALIATGVSPGAALVFLMAGPATNAATITTIWKILGRTTTIIYLIVMAITALISGLLLDKFLLINNSMPSGAFHEAGPNLVEIISALLILFIFGYSVLWPVLKKVTGFKQTEKGKSSSCCGSDKNCN